MRRAEALYLADNSQLSSDAPGIAYRLSPILEHKDLELLPWGNSVRARDLGDGWVQLPPPDGRFLPTSVGGVPVLVPMPQHDARSQRAATASAPVAVRGRSPGSPQNHSQRGAGGRSSNLPGLALELNRMAEQFEQYASRWSAVRPSYLRSQAGALVGRLESAAAELEQLVLAAQTERRLERDARSPSITKRVRGLRDGSPARPALRSAAVAASPPSPLRNLHVGDPSRDGEQESDRLEHLGGDEKEAAALGGAAFPGVKLVSLGCYCGPKLTFQRMGRGAETLPFDWVRTRFEGLLHFLRTDFEGFFDFVTKQQVPGCHMTMYRGPLHSFWHDDPTDPSMHERYGRRIKRFLELGASSQPVLFVRVAADAALELAHALELARELAMRFGALAKLLLILNFQDASGHFLLEGCKNAMVSCLPASVHRREDPAFRAPFAAPVLAGLAWAAGCSPDAGEWPVRTVDEARQLIRADTSGCMGLGGLRSFEEL